MQYKVIYQQITKKIDEDENYKKVLELANIPLYNYKKNIKSQIKPVPDYSERVKLCLYGPNTYFGDDELLHLEKRKTQATCVSQEGVLYRLSLKKLVKIVCNQNNIWELLQENLSIKKKWQKQFFSQLNEEYRQNKLNESMNLNKQSLPDYTYGQFPVFLQNLKFQSRPHYKGFKDNFSHNILNVYSETANNILSLQKKKSNSPKPKQVIQNNIQKNDSHSFKKSSQGSNQFIILESYEDNFVSQNSPIQTTRYFNLKQELLNKQFFVERSRNLIEVQQNVSIAKRFKEYQNNIKKLEIFQNEQDKKQKIKECQDQKNNEQQQSPKAQLSQRKKEVLLLSINEKNSPNILAKQQQNPRNKQISRNKQRSDSNNQTSRQQSPRNEIESNKTKKQIDRNTLVRKDENEQNSDLKKDRECRDTGIKVDLGIFHEIINEENADQKKEIWDQLSSSQEKITTQKFYDQLMDAVYGDKRPCTKIDLRSKTFYRKNIKRNNNKNIKLNQSLNCSNTSQLVEEKSSIIQDKAISQLQSPSGSSTPIQDQNPFRSYYNQNKNKQNILDKLRFRRLMRPQIDEYVNQDLSESQLNASFFTTQVQLSPLKLPSGSLTSREDQRSKSIQNQSCCYSQKNSQIFSQQTDRQSNQCKKQVLKQQQYPILGKRPKQNINQSYNESIDLNSQTQSISQYNKNSILSSIIQNDDQNDSQQLSGIFQESQKYSDNKQYPHFDQQQFSQKIESLVNNKLNIPNYNRVYKEGDNIYIKTGGFTIKRPCPQRFINQI